MIDIGETIEEKYDLEKQVQIIEDFDGKTDEELQMNIPYKYKRCELEYINIINLI